MIVSIIVANLSGMGEAKRRKQISADSPQVSAKTNWWTKEKSAQFVQITTKGAWIGIGVMVVYWVVVRFVGPALGWWQLQD